MSQELGWYYFIRDLTNVGMPGTYPWQSLLNDELVHKFSPSRYNFYMQLVQGLMNPNSKSIVDTVLTLQSTNKARREEIIRRSNEISKILSYLASSSDKPQDMSTIHNTEELLKAIPFLKGMQDDFNGNPLSPKLRIEYKKPGTTTPVPTKGQGGGGSKFQEYYERLKEQQELLKSAEDLNKKQQAKNNIRDILIQYQNDPITSPDNARLRAADRIMFIAGTFLLRIIAIFVVQWGVQAYFVRDFNTALLLYLGTYLSLVGLWWILTNASRELLNFRILFYYLSSSHGYGRIIAHVFIHLMLLPIIFGFQTKPRQGEDITSIEYRRKIMSGVNNFSFYTWAVCSAFALYY